MAQADENVAGNTRASPTEGSRSASASKPLIAVYGATSKQGRSVAATLLQSGRFNVRALTRNRDSKEARNLELLGAEIAIVPAGLGHFRELVTAFTGAEGVYLMTPQLDPQGNVEFALGKELADAAVEAGVNHIVFSTLENVDKITNGKKLAPHFTDKALVADYIRSLPVSHSFVMLAYFYTNLLEYYVPRVEGGKLLMPQLDPQGNVEFALGKELADAAVEAGVNHIVFSTLENVDKITNGKKLAPHFTDKALVADYIRSLPVSHSFVMLAYFYTNLLEYYVPRVEGGKLLMPIYLPEDFRAPFVDPVTATGPAVLELLSNPGLYGGKTLPLVGDIISPREMVETFQRVTGIEAEYRNAYSRENLLHYFPDFANNEPLVDELIGMVEYSVEYGYFSENSDLEWSRRLNSASLNWEQFLLANQWQGESRPFGG